MAILQSVTYGGQTFEVPDKLSELSDVNVPANAANGSILALQNGKWTPNTVEGAIGGKPVLVAGAQLQSSTVGDAGGKSLQLFGVYPDGSRQAANFVDEQGVAMYRAESGGDWQLVDIIGSPSKAVLTGLNTSQFGTITASDTVLSAFGKLYQHGSEYTIFENAAVSGSVSVIRQGYIVIISGNVSFANGYTGGKFLTLPYSVNPCGVSSRCRVSGVVTGSSNAFISAIYDALSVDFYDGQITVDGTQLLFSISCFAI